jgi:hypothetical protein
MPVFAGMTNVITSAITMRATALRSVYFRKTSFVEVAMCSRQKTFCRWICDKNIKACEYISQGQKMEKPSLIHWQ